jgi:hypothetical protein
MFIMKKKKKKPSEKQKSQKDLKYDNTWKNRSTKNRTVMKNKKNRKHSKDN